MDEENEEVVPVEITVVTKLPNEEAKVTKMKNDYKTISNFCEGLIDMTSHPKDDQMSIICNDNFLMNGMKTNIVVPEREEVYCGPLIFCGYDEETGNSISLTDKQIEMTLKYCKRNMLHNMSLEGAYRYAKVIGPFQESEDALTKEEMEAS
jgi:hypothetical protein